MQPQISGRVAREGERKHLTVLIADIAGSTALIDHLNAEQAAERLGTIIAALREAVTRFEGTVTKLQGDGLMALFGAPVSQEDHAIRACCAGLAMVENIQRIAEAPPVRIGINTGEVVVRTMWTDMSAQYEAMGRTVHVAARLEQEAPGFGVWISETTRRATGGLVDTQDLGQRTLRGISEGIGVHLLKKIRPAITSQQFRLGQRLSPFVDRHTEYQALQQALDEASAGRSRVVGIEGEAGSGKSRLLFEFLEHCRRLGRPVLEARATGFGRATPLRPILDLTRIFFGIEEATPDAEAAAMVRAGLARYQLERDLPLLLDFLGLPVDRRLVPTDVADRHAKLLDVVRRAARAIARAVPAVLVLEDLHWLDPASEPFVDALANSIAGTPSLMVVNFRPGYSRAWMSKSFWRHVVLTALPPDHLDTMLRGLPGAPAASPDLRRRIGDRSGGNPFFAEELMRAMGDTPPADGGTAIALPSTIEAVLGARIDRLAEADKLVLQAASVIGREFSLTAVPDVAALPPDQTRRALQRLMATEMVYERLDIRRNEFAFRHPLVQEAAYASLLSDQRRRLHRAAALALTTQFRDRPDEYSALIAHHWELAGEPLQAATSYVKSALWIGARDPRQALETWRSVRRLLQDHPPAPPVDYMLMMACGQMVNYAWWQGIDAAEIEPVFRQAIALAHKLGDMRAATLITMAFGRVLVATGSSDDYVAKVEEAQAFSRESNNPSVAAVLKAVYSHALLTAGQLARALEANAAALACVHQIEPADRQTLGFDPEPWLKVQQARILLFLGQDRASAELLDALLNGEAIDTVHRVNALGTRIEAARQKGLPAASEAAQLRATLKGNETPYLKVLGNRYLVLALLSEGAAQQAADLSDQTLDYARTQRAGLELEPYLLTALAESLIRCGAPRAREVAAEAAELARRRAMRLAEQDARRLLQEVAG